MNNNFANDNFSDNNPELAQILFPAVTETPADMESRFPPRDLPDSAEVTRIGPSPTGFIHLGNLYSAFADERLARRTGGRFFLRIEDTDDKRRVPGAVEIILSALGYFGISFDEGAELGTPPGETYYGPFYQRERRDIYHVYAKYLVEKNLAYPCFCTETELSDTREAQASSGAQTGYYGKWARCRELSVEQIKKSLAEGKKYTLRLRSGGKEGEKFKFRDEIMGELELSESFQDIVLLKSDGIPTYHFAHAVDDHLMRTTTVIRGGEWLPSAPIHIELFRALGFTPPKYAHTAQLMKIDGGKKRKLSKRKDPELSLEFYRELGYHPTAMKLYLLTILNSNFEEWRAQNMSADIDDFPFELSKMGASGILFDLMKLDDISREFFAEQKPEEIIGFFAAWLKKYHPEETGIFLDNPDKLKKIIMLNLGLFENRRRKDIVSASRLRELIAYFYEELFSQENIDFSAYPCAEQILRDFLAEFDISDDTDAWFGKVKNIAQRYNYCVKAALYKKDPAAYNGSLSHAAELYRVAVTGRKNTPDLWNILQILGEDAVKARLAASLARLRE